MMKMNNTVKKVVVYRLLSFVLCSLLAAPFFDTFIQSVWVTLYLNIAMTITHYWFEKLWHKGNWDP